MALSKFARRTIVQVLCTLTAQEKTRTYRDLLSTLKDERCNESATVPRALHDFSTKMMTLDMFCQYCAFAMVFMPSLTSLWQHLDKIYDYSV